MKKLLSIIVLSLALATAGFAQQGTTTLNGSIGAATTLIAVNNPALLPANSFVIQIDSEKMNVTGVSGANYVVTRAYAGTSAATHANTAAVSYVLGTGSTAPQQDSTKTVRLNGGISAAATQLFVTDGLNPGVDQFGIQIDSEIMTVTAISGARYTVTRAASSTSAAAHNANSVVSRVLGAVAGAVTPGGSDTQIQYNNSGAFGGAPLTYAGSAFTLTGGSTLAFTGSSSSTVAINTFGIANGSTKLLAIKDPSAASQGFAALNSYTSSSVYRGMFMSMVSGSGSITTDDVSGSTDAYTIDIFTGAAANDHGASLLIHASNVTSFNGASLNLQPGTSSAAGSAYLSGSHIVPTANFVDWYPYSGNTVEFGVVDNDSGFVTWLTLTKGAAPTVVISPPAGGTTIAITTTTFTVTGAATASGLSTASGTPSSICQNADTKEITVNAALTCTVSARDQKNTIAPLALSATDLVLGLQPVSFKYNDVDRVRYGFIAEDVAAVDPRFGDAWNGDDARSLDLPALLAVSVKAIQELEARVKVLEAGIAAQK